MSLKPRTSTVTLYQGDDLAEIAERAKAIDDARAEAGRTTQSLAEGDQVAARVDEYNAFLAEAGERAEVLRFEHLGRLAFRDLLAQHPVRNADEATEAEREADAAWGANDLTFPAALVLACWRDARSENERTRFIDDLCEADFDRLVAACYTLCKAPLAPKALTLSEVMPRSAGM